MRRLIWRIKVKTLLCVVCFKTICEGMRDLQNLPIIFVGIRIAVFMLSIRRGRPDRANSVDPDQTPQNAASDHGLLCLPLIQQF